MIKIKNIYMFFKNNFCVYGVITCFYNSSKQSLILAY